jgi:hypothetical protein
VSEVARLPAARHESPEKAAALGMSLQVDLGAGRVCTLQTFIPADAHLVELNMMLDKMTSAGDRQRAHYKIEEKERELAQLEKDQAQHQEDLDRIDVDYEAAQARRMDQAEKAVKSADDYEVAAKANWNPAKRGEYKQSKHDEANLARVRGGVDKLKGEMDVAKAEHDKAHGESAKTMERRLALIEKTRAEIARCREIVADGLKA